MNPRHYILDANGEPVLEPDLMTWAAWMEGATNRRVAKDIIGESKVSTMFLGLDHSFQSEYEEPQPIFWETMVFGGKLDQEMDRCGGSREQAKAMHARMVERVKATQ